MDCIFIHTTTLSDPSIQLELRGRTFEASNSDPLARSLVSIACKAARRVKTGGAADSTKP